MKRKKIVKKIIIVMIVMIVIYYSIGACAYLMVISPQFTKELKEEYMGRISEQTKNLKELYSDIGVKVNDVTITSTNNGKLKLHGYEVMNNIVPDSDKWAIVIHGYNSTVGAMRFDGERFFEKGYNVIYPELRGNGLSEGNYYGMGWHERLDIIDWINYIIEKNPNCQIVLYGVSMGGATVMATTGEKLPDNVKAAIEDCGYTSVWDEFTYQLNNRIHLPVFPVLYSANAVCKIIAKYDFKEASPLKQVAKSKTPTLFIHGAEDTYVPTRMIYPNYENASCEKEILLIEGAGHCGSSIKDPELYWGRVFGFVNKYVK